MAKLPNHRLVKLHRSYSVEEAAKCLDAHKNTIRRWIKGGLATVGGRGQTLILGTELRAFLEARRRAAKRPCPLGHLFCLKCRDTRPPAGQMVEYEPITAKSGDLRALCPECLTVMHRRITETNLARFCADLEVTQTHPLKDICGRAFPSLNSDSR